MKFKTKLSSSPPYPFIKSLTRVDSLNSLIESVFLQNFNFICFADPDIIIYEARREKGYWRIGHPHFHFTDPCTSTCSENLWKYYNPSDITQWNWYHSLYLFLRIELIRRFSWSNQGRHQFSLPTPKSVGITGTCCINSWISATSSFQNSQNQILVFIWCSLMPEHRNLFLDCFER